MGQENRTDLKATILANLPDNTTEAITPEKHREVENNIADSNFNLLTDDATNVNYNPTSVGQDWTPEGDPSQVGAALDILAQRTFKFPSPNILYVSESGDDTDAEIGNSLKPYATFEQAFLDAPANNFIIQSLGGEFTETFTINTPNSKTNFIFRLDGTIINGDVKLQNCTDGVVYLGGGTINGELDVALNNSQNISVFDGTINGLLRIGENCNLSFCRIINNAGSYALLVDVLNLNDRPFISNCYIESTNATAYNGIANFNTCFIKGNNVAFQPASSINPNLINKFTNCTLISNGTTLLGSGQVLNGIFKRCHIESTANYAMQIGSSNTQYLFFEDCDIVGANDVVFIGSSLVRPLGTSTTFKRCSFYTKDAATKEIFVEQGYSGSDQGKFQLIGTTVYNKAFTTSDPTRFEVLGDQLTITDAQIPSF